MGGGKSTTKTRANLEGSVIVMENGKYWVDDDGYIAHGREVENTIVSGVIDPLHIQPLTGIIESHDDLLKACKHGAMSIHHPSCSHGKRGAGDTCECHVGKCQQAITKATD